MIKKLVFYFTASIIVIVIIIQIIKVNILTKQLYEIKQKYKSFGNYLVLKQEYEGHFISEFYDKEKISKIYSLNDFSTVMSIDTIECYTCFKFHMEKLLTIHLPIIVLTKDKDMLIKPYLNDANIIKGILPVSGIAIMMINKKGRIIYFDFADKTNYEKSKAFYNVIKNYQDTSTL